MAADGVAGFPRLAAGRRQLCYADRMENSALHIAATRGDAQAVRDLLEGGADPNARGERGCTPLHCALEAKHPQVARILIAAGGSLDAANAEGMTAREMTASCPLWEGDT